MIVDYFTLNKEEQFAASKKIFYYDYVSGIDNDKTYLLIKPNGDQRICDYTTITFDSETYALQCLSFITSRTRVIYIKKEPDFSGSLMF